MLNKIKASTKLTFLVLILCGFIFGIGVYGIHELKIMNQNTKTLYEDRVFPLEQLTTIRNSYAMGVLYTARQADSRQLSFTQALQQIQEAVKNINVTWEAYKLTYLTAEESRLIRQAEPLMAQGNTTINKLKDAINKKDELAINDIVNKELSADISPVISKLNELVRLQVTVSGELYKKGAKEYKSTRSTFYISIAISLVFVLLLSFLIIGDNRRLIKNLEASNRKISVNEEKFRAFIKYAGDAIFILDEEFRITDVNHSACKLLGYSAGELLQMKISDVMPPEEHENFSERVEIIKRYKGSLHERKFRRKDGSYVDTEINVRELEGQGYVSIIRDITERLKAEAELKRSEERHRALVENISDAITVIAENGELLYRSPSVERINGYSFEEVKNKTILDFIHPDDKERCAQFLKKVYASPGVPMEDEFRMEHRKGHYIWIEATVQNLFHVESVKALVINYRDISVRKEAELKFRDLVEKSMVGVYIIQNGMLAYVNPRFAEIFGYTQKELLNLFSPTDLVYKDDIEMVTENIRAKISGEMEASHYDVRGIKKDGEMIWIEIYSSATVYQGNNALIGSLVDITERKIAEKELAESEEKFRSLVEQSLVGVYIMQDSKFIYVNPGFQKAIGYSEETLLNKLSFDDLVHEEDLEMIKKNYLLRLSGENPPSQYIFKAIKSDGSILHLEVIASTIIYDDRPATIGTLIDITDRVEEEKRIGKAVNDAQERERIQIGMELHDNVKQILAASLMSLDHVKSNLTNKKLATETLDNLKSYVREAIDELRRLSHQLAPSIDTDDTMTEKIKRLVSTMNKTDQLQVNIDIHEFKQPIHNDIQIAFYRILQEQFNNILKYSKATSVFIGIKLDQNNINLLIKDNGKGFDTNIKKDGIGLENIRRRTHVLGGQVKILSSPGNGCEVNVQIPV